jgi:hypothetical protein
MAGKCFKKTKSPDLYWGKMVMRGYLWDFFIPILPDHFSEKSLLPLNRSGSLIFLIPGIFRAIAHIIPNRSRLFDFPVLQ